jgi:2,3-bisphosphoglycerate-independent phosphoglycerate mutase
VKNVIIIADGGADFGLPELGGKTPFEAARTPNLDGLAKVGRMGTAMTTPPGFEAGSDVCSMCLLGYDPAKYHTGRAPLEAAAIGLRLAATDWIFRLNFVTVGEEGTADAGGGGGAGGVMLDHSAGAISGEEGRELARGLAEHWGRVLPALARDFELTPGVSYRNILVDHGGRGKRDYAAMKTKPPHEMPGQQCVEFVPRTTSEDARMRAGVAAVNELMAAARAYLPGHPVNRARVAAGKRPANAAWIWGQGLKPSMPSFAERYGGRSGAMITAVDLLAGIAAFIGWERVDSPGITSYHDSDYAMQGKVTCGAIERFDVVCSHVESPDEASHQGDWKTKVAAVEAMDEHVVGPVVRHLRSKHADGWRVMVMPDHYTLVSTRKHDATPPPWLIAGSDVLAIAGGAGRYSEVAATGAGSMRVEPGDRIMELFLNGKFG